MNITLGQQTSQSWTRRRFQVALTGCVAALALIVAVGTAVWQVKDSGGTSTASLPTVAQVNQTTAASISYYLVDSPEKAQAVQQAHYEASLTMLETVDFVQFYPINVIDLSTPEGLAVAQALSSDMASAMEYGQQFPNVHIIDLTGDKFAP